ncbi:Protein O-mannosyltransferase 2 [Tulasnella sp. JGI-2019a]|nr:Protein O-mannosyltransferase 2 [Tulasnella sp. JGI-2019a]
MTSRVPSTNFDEISPSRSSSFEEIQYSASDPNWANHHRLQETLPLHNMGDTTRRRQVGGLEPSINGGDGAGWATSPPTIPLSPYAPAGHSEAIWQDSDGKNVYEKAASYGGRLPLPRQRRRPPPSSFGELIDQNMDIIPPIIYTLLACWTRFYDIGKSNFVVWDEAHFGKFGSHYLKRDFYFDVHPPLGKMLVGLAGALSGYDGNYEFKSGEAYPDSVPYVAMRVMLAMFGVAMVPLAWFTSVELHLSPRACHLVTLMVLYLAWICISRFILLDSMLICFTFTTVFCMAKFNNQQWKPFSIDWWVWLCMTGFSIGCVCSVKWVGFFVTALVGAYTVEDLWERFGDLKMPPRIYLKHWLARGLCLVILPMLVYMASFKLHFMILNRSGSGDSQMSSLFQANLEGNDFKNNPLEVAIGSKVTLKNIGYGGGLLHSHVQTYPVGSFQQQVTCYHYKDDNNNFEILRQWGQPAYSPTEPIQLLKDGDIIRLSHGPTKRNIHGHTIAAPVTKANYEISGYGNATIGDHNDHWQVEVVDDIILGNKKYVKAVRSLTTRMRFRHVTNGCYMRAANAVLPPWGFKQVEVSCDKENNPKDKHTYWNVESHWNERMPSGDQKLYRSPFLADFWHLNIAMMTSNNALVPDPDKEDILASLPSEWPWLHTGLRMCGWGDNQIKYYLIGHPLIWWGGSVSLILSVFALVVYLLRMQRQYSDWKPGEWEHFLYVGKVAFIGWCLHFAPFLIMGRVTYLHHYLPTLYFAVIMIGHMMDHFFFTARRLNERVKWSVFIVSAAAIVGVFWWFRGVAFGIDGPIGSHHGLAWRKSWNIY